MQGLYYVVPREGGENFPGLIDRPVIRYLELFSGVRRHDAHSLSTRLPISVRVLLLARVSLEVLKCWPGSAR